MGLNSTFANSVGGKLSTYALVGLLAVSPMFGSAAQAEGRFTPVTHGPSTSILTDSERAEISVLDRAADYAEAHPGQIAVSVLKGSDAKRYTGEQMAQGIAENLKKFHNIDAVGYAGDNGPKATEIRFHYVIKASNGDPVVVTDGPYNGSDAIRKIPEVALSASVPDWLAVNTFGSGPAGQD